MTTGSLKGEHSEKLKDFLRLERWEETLQKKEYCPKLLNAGYHFYIGRESPERKGAKGKRGDGVYFLAGAGIVILVELRKNLMFRPPEVNRVGGGGAGVVGLINCILPGKRRVGNRNKKRAVSHALPEAGGQDFPLTPWHDLLQTPKCQHPSTSSQSLDKVAPHGKRGAQAGK